MELTVCGVYSWVENSGMLAVFWVENIEYATFDSCLLLSGIAVSRGILTGRESTVRKDRAYCSTRVLEWKFSMLERECCRLRNQHPVAEDTAY